MILILRNVPDKLNYFVGEIGRVLRLPRILTALLKGREDLSTVKDVLDRHNNRAPGFDLMRLALACEIFWQHAGWLSIGLSGASADSYSALITSSPDFHAVGSLSPALHQALHLALVPMFFALSGFLVTGSAERVRALKPFLAFRLLRIIPALTVEVTLSAFILGGIFTQLPLREYFSDPQFFRYFGNIFGFVTFELPGLFQNNPVPRMVNGNLWTLPAEFYCYLITAALIWTGLLFKRKIILISLLLVTTLLIIGDAVFGLSELCEAHYPALVIIHYFCVGCCFYLWRDWVPRHVGLFIGALIASIILLNCPRGAYISTIFLTYAMIFVGTMEWPKIPLIQRGDYSYGIYLYGYPLLQALMAAVPSLQGHKFVVAALGGAITIMFAACSWHWIEQPTLSLKKRFSARVIPQSPGERLA